MTRKDYELIARALNTVYVDGDRETVKLAAEALADELVKDNPRFERGRFFEAVTGR